MKYLLIVIMILMAATSSVAQYWRVTVKFESQKDCLGGYWDKDHSPAYFPQTFINGLVTDFEINRSETWKCCTDAVDENNQLICSTESYIFSAIVNSSLNGCPSSIDLGDMVVYFNRLPIPTPTVSPIDPNGCTNTRSFSTAELSSVNFEWQVSENLIDWHTFGVNSHSVTATREELLKPGFSIQGLRYVRVRDPNCPGVTSAPSESFTFPVPSPTAQILPTDPLCHDGAGSIAVIVTSADISRVNDFLIRLYDADILNDPEEVPIGQYQLLDIHQGSNQSLITKFGVNGAGPDLTSGTYYVLVTNQSDINMYQSCSSLYGPIAINNPAAVTITNIVKSNYNGLDIHCHGSANGTLEANPTGGTGTYAEFEWFSVTNNLTLSTKTQNVQDLSAGTFKVKTKDSNGCWSNWSNDVSLVDPPLLTVDAVSAGGSGGYEVSCLDRTDGRITTTVAGRPPQFPAFAFQWKKNASSYGGDTNELTKLGIGTYEVTVTDANGCTASDSEELTAPQPLSVTIAQVAGIECPDAATGVLTADVASGAIGAVTYLWSSGETSASIADKLPGNYTVTIKDAQTCTASDSHELDNPPAYTVAIAPTSSYNGSYITCNGAADGSIVATLMNPNNNQVVANNYLWSRNGDPYPQGTGFAQLEDLDAASYQVRATYGQNCIAQATYNLIQPASVTINFQTSDYNGFAIRCPGDANGVLTAIASGGTAGNYTYQWTDGPNTQDFTDLEAGDYFVTVQDINGCEGSSSFQLEDPPPIIPSIQIVSDYNGQALTCTGANDAVLSASATGGASPYGFKWNIDQATEQVSNLPAGNYSVEVTDANGCVVQSSVTEISDPDPVEAGIEILSNYNGQAIRCFNEANGSIQAIGNGGTNSFTYQWNTSETTAEIGSLLHGDYAVTISDQNGCSDVAMVSLENPAPVVADILTHSDFNGFGVQCHASSNGFIEIAAVGGTNVFSFEWPTLSQTTARVEELPSGVYPFVVTDNNGCSDNGAFEISAPPVLTIDELSRQDVTCFGAANGSLLLVAAGGFGQYEYSLNGSQPQSDAEFKLLAAEVPLTFYVRDQNNCSSEYQTELLQPDEIQIDFVVEPSQCNEPVGKATALVSGGIGNFTYEWTNADAGFVGSEPIISNVSPGIYFLQVHDSELCSMKKPIAVESLDGPQAQVLENFPASCYESADGFARIGITEGLAPFSVSWEDGQSSMQVSNLSRGIHYVSVTDVNGCSSTLEVNTLSPAKLLVSVKAQKAVSCAGLCDGSIELNAEGGNGDYQFTWNDVPGTSLATGLCSGTHSVKVADRSGCIVNETFSLSEPEPVSLRVVERTLPRCNSGCDGSIEVVAAGGTQSYNYTWSTGVAGPLQSGLCAGAYTATAIDGNNCLVSRTIQLGEPAGLQLIQVESRKPLCFGDCNGMLRVIAQGGTGAYNYRWMDGLTDSRNGSLCAGSHGVQVTDANNCIASEIYTLAEGHHAEIFLGGGKVVCEGEVYELDAGPSWSKVEWRSEGKVLSTERKIDISQPGAYNVEVTDLNNCKATDEFVLETSDDLLESNFIMPAQAHAADTVVMIDVSWPLPENIAWTFPEGMVRLKGNADVIHGKFDNPGVYDVILTATLGRCKDEVMKSITILDQYRSVEGGRLGAEEFVKKITLYPNPNTGSFDVEIEFTDKSEAIMTIWNVVTGILITKAHSAEDMHHSKHFDLSPVTSGTYLLRIDYKGGHRMIKFLVH